MSRIILERLRFFYEDAKKSRLLLADTGDFSANESRGLLHYLDDEDHIVWEMRDNLKNVAEYIGKDTASGAPLRAAMAILAIRALWGKYRPRRVIWMGAYNRAAIGVSKMMPIFHDENLLYAVFPDLPTDIEERVVVPIRAECVSLPLPEAYFDVAVVESADVSSDRMAEILLSLRANGLLLFFLPADVELACALPEAVSLSDEEGNRLVQLRMSGALAAMFREGTKKGRVERQKRLVAYILDEVGDALGTVLASGDDARLDAAITQATLAEENLLPIYEELSSEDIKYFANRFKESLIEYRLHRSEKTRARVFDEYLALRREMRECDDF